MQEQSQIKMLSNVPALKLADTKQEEKNVKTKTCSQCFVQYFQPCSFHHFEDLKETYLNQFGLENRK